MDRHSVKAADLRRWKTYFESRNTGNGVEASARKAKLSTSVAYRFERNDPTCGGLEAADILGVDQVAGNFIDKPLSPDALTALEDFTTFRLRYMGRKSTPWQEKAAYDVLRYLETPDREYVVINEPPGSGKSTLFTHDIICWLIARDRTIRIQVGSRTERMAQLYVSRIKRTLERDAPLRANADNLARGLAFDALACMQDDYGAFKPEGRSEKWQAKELVVRQLDGVALDDKESTVSAWGQDSGFLGGRFDLVIWDDLVAKANIKTEESRILTRDWWDEDAESRLEPGGVLILQGQRMAGNDLYRWCLDKKDLDEKPKYRHVVYKAHDEERCTFDHGADAKPWPDGCLLDPHRLPWKLLEGIQHNNPRSYSVLYQQEDGDHIGGLIDPTWITGGIDHDGYNAPGCLDKHRGINDPPQHLYDNGWSFITVDPSPTEFWGIIWWLYDPDTGNRYAIDIIRRRMNPEQFLSIDFDTFEWSGLLVDMFDLSNDLDYPITHVIFEINAAQRWFLTQPHAQKWMQMTGMTFIPHTTSIRKQDDKYGLESIGDLFRQGMIRLPYKDPSSRLKVANLVDEATRYPDGETTDLIMSVWFHKLGVENHYTPRIQGRYQLDRPGWMGNIRRGVA
jgi:hypothetical protein